jgi:exopolyphosphatase/guanosine-5'-triphosphate,3'-diphosphate pyrophosphatase
VRTVEVRPGDETLRIVVHADGDATVEVWDANRRAGLMKKAFGRNVEIVAAP